MTTLIAQAARLYLDACEKGHLEPEMENSELVVLLNELNTLAKTPDTRYDRAERGRIAVEIFGMNDDIDTMAADVIADILHWVTNQSGPDLAGATHFRAAGYYNEER
jgi:hypothetical protein